MSRLPLAWRPGLVAAALVLVVCAVARPSSVRRTWQRVRGIGLALAIVAGELLVLVEHRVTRWCRAHGHGPLRPLGCVTDLVDRKVVQPCEARRSTAPAVPPVRRVILFTLVAAAFTPSAAWLAMGHWPSTPLARSTRAAFDRWSTFEQRLRLGGVTDVAAEQVVAPATATTVTASPPHLAWYGLAWEASTLFGDEGDVPVVADLDGDGTSELIAFRPATGQWRINGRTDAPVLGDDGDVPVPGDYRGMGRAQLAVFRPATGEWLVDGLATPIVLGRLGDVPVPAAYAAAGAVQPAVYRPSTGEWFGAGRPEPVRFGEAGDVPVPADYDGDGRADVAVFRPATGEWWIAGAGAPVVHGAAGDLPVPAAYAGSTRALAAVYRPSTGELLVAGREPVGTGAADGTPLVIRRRGATALAVVVIER